MRTAARRGLIGVCLAACCLGLAGLGRADDDDDGAEAEHGHDHERARHAVERGEALPLSEIIARVRPSLGGEVVGVNFGRRGGRWVYAFRVISDGQLTEVHVDAATAQVIDRETR